MWSVYNCFFLHRDKARNPGRIQKRVCHKVYATTFGTLFSVFADAKKQRNKYLYQIFPLFLCSLTVAAHELINTTSCVNQLALTCIEWVRGV